MTSIVKLVWRRWCKFWFEADYKPQIRLFSKTFGLLLFWYSLSRTQDLVMAYSKESFMPLQVLRDFPEMIQHYSVLSLFDSMGMVWIIHLALLSSLLGMVFGIMPGFCALVAFICEQAFLNRNVSFAYGVDLISSVFLFYLALGDYRLDTLKKRDWKVELGSVAYRLAQLQVCIIYAYAGLDKVKGPSWWKGEALWFVFFNPQYAVFDFSWVAHYPFLLVLATYSSMLWEVYFPALVWVKSIRYPVLLFGVSLHVGIAVFMGLPTFGVLMMLLYLLFLQPQDAQKIAVFAKKALQPRKVLVGKADESYV